MSREKHISKCHQIAGRGTLKRLHMGCFSEHPCECDVEAERNKPS